MGAEILDKRQAKYKKHIDKNRNWLAQKDLFTIDPSMITPIIVCDSVDSVSIRPGDSVVVQASAGKLVTFKGQQRVGECKNPPQPTYDSICNGGGAVRAHISTQNPLSGTFEASICQ